jgi:hypothetical protein
MYGVLEPFDQALEVFKPGLECPQTPLDIRLIVRLAPGGRPRLLGRGLRPAALLDHAFEQPREASAASGGVAPGHRSGARRGRRTPTGYQASPALPS